MANIAKERETIFFEACKRGLITKARETLNGVTPSSLKEWRTSEGRTCLHVAVLAGDPGLLGELAAKLPELIEVTDNQVNTALHLAVQTYRVDLMKQLLGKGAKLRDCENRMWEGRTCLHVAVMAGDSDLIRKIAQKLPVLMNKMDKDGDTALHLAVRIYRVDLVKQLLKLANADLPDFVNTKWNGRTILHVTLMAGDSELLEKIARKSPVLMNMKDNNGDTALHLAVLIYRVDLVNRLLELQAELDLEDDLCDCKNNEQETPLDIAISMQFVEAVEVLIPCTKAALEDESKFVLHRVVSLNQVRLLEIFIKCFFKKMSELINLPYEPALNLPQTENCDNEGSRALNPQHIQLQHTAVRNNYEHDKCRSQSIVRGDMPLHIAARNKYEHMVKLLLKVPMVNKHACNSEGKTPLDIAREVTEYHESFKTIKCLRDAPPKCKPFMYCAPQVSREKYLNAMEMVKKAFEERRNSELVVGALLATMTFTAAFTVPGGFNSNTEEEKELGSPILIRFTPFKLFLIFDCIAFFLSLLVCIMWEMSSELTTDNKIRFMTISSSVVCLSFGVTAFGFMGALYTVLAHRVWTFAWVVLGSLTFIAFCGFVTYLIQSAKFVVSRARLQRLCGFPDGMDDLVIWAWDKFERAGLLDMIRSCRDRISDFGSGQLNTCRARICQKTYPFSACNIYNCCCSSIAQPHDRGNAQQ